MMKVSDFVISFLESKGVKDVFLISGGGMMHLLDSIGKSKKIKYYCNLNEQATSICADAYAQATNGLAVCMVTTGPGGTNAITGIAAAYLDSEPILTISGQVKTSDLVGKKGVRQIGPQEVNIVEIVKPITKYAVLVTRKEEIKYHLDKAIYLATHGRRGPVWVDIPLDIQGGQIDEQELLEFDPIAEGLERRQACADLEYDKILALLNEAKRPVVLIGHGVIAAGAAKAIRETIEQSRIPVLATWRAKMAFPDDHELYFGHPGSPGPRYSNFILQNADFLLIIGTRLNVGVTAFNERNFAPKAKKVIVDIDNNEIAKLDMDFELRIVCDAGLFIQGLRTTMKQYKGPGTSEWLDYCDRMRRLYPITRESQSTPSLKTNMYLFGSKLSSYTKRDDVIVTASSGRSCGILNLSYTRSEGQVEIGSMGLGSMGFTLPAAIGACVASDKRRTICLEGDGSLQHNLQELMLIGTYGLPVKLFVLNNEGYASIVVMQANHFHSNLVACNERTGVKFPPLERIALLYGLDFYRIANDGEIDGVLKDVMADDRPILCEVLGDSSFDEIPKAISKVLPDGKIVSSKLEDLFPFLPEEKTAEAMRLSWNG